MELNLDPKLNKQLRDTLNEQHNFMFEKKAEFNIPGKERKKEESNAFNCICACLDRIDSLVEHCNAISKNIKDTYGLCDILNYGQTLIDCISMIAKIYSVSYNSEDDISCFNEVGLDGKGNDEKYFKYIRSLCSVHPVETSYHSAYQGNQPEWCPWISKPGLLWDIGSYYKEKSKGADFIAVVYRNDDKYNKHVYISLKQIFQYIRKRYSYIEEIINEIRRQNKEKIYELRNKHILLPEECKDYDSYLNELKLAIEERYGDDHSWRINEWKAILGSHFNDDNFEKILELYKVELKRGIEKIHKSLQGMELDYYFEEEAVAYITSFIPSEYGYSLSKIHYLEPIWESEDIDLDKILLEDKYLGDYSRIAEMLDMVIGIQNDIDKDDVFLINRIIDTKYHTTDSEWARIQLKWLEPYCDVKFNYELSDWYLYLQVIVAFWNKARTLEK